MGNIDVSQLDAEEGSVLTAPPPAAVRLFKAAISVSEIACLACGDQLDMHQPDEEDAGRLLGVCGGCGRWFAVVERGGADWAEAVACELPSADDVLAMAPAD
jgi:hypothetical protein